MNPIIRQLEQEWEDDDWGEADLSLEQTRLLVYPDEVLRLNVDGSTVLRIPLESIESVDIRLRLNPASITPMIASGIMFAMGLYVSTSNWFSCILYLLAMVTGLSSLHGLVRGILVLGRREQPLEIAVLESPDKVHGFVVSLREMLPKK